ncbi:unnamed protein product [Auanema sp. JU1783]|nr:unnamed protein product [Auanema sp. JU1783]
MKVFGDAGWSKLLHGYRGHLLRSATTYSITEYFHVLGDFCVSTSDRLTTQLPATSITDIRQAHDNEEKKKSRHRSFSFFSAPGKEKELISP